MMIAAVPTQRTKKVSCGDVMQTVNDGMQKCRLAVQETAILEWGLEQGGESRVQLCKASCTQFTLCGPQRRGLNGRPHEKRQFALQLAPGHLLTNCLWCYPERTMSRALLVHGAIVPALHLLSASLRAALFSVYSGQKWPYATHCFQTRILHNKCLASFVLTISDPFTMVFNLAFRSSFRIISRLLLQVVFAMVQHYSVDVPSSLDGHQGLFSPQAGERG